MKSQSNHPSIWSPPGRNSVACKSTEHPTPTCSAQARTGAAEAGTGPGSRRCYEVASDCLQGHKPFHIQIAASEEQSPEHHIGPTNGWSRYIEAAKQPDPGTYVGRGQYSPGHEGWPFLSRDLVQMKNIQTDEAEHINKDNIRKPEHQPHPLRRELTGIDHKREVMELFCCFSTVYTWYVVLWEGVPW